MKKILLLGYTGTVGSSLYDELKSNYDIMGKNSKDFDATNPETFRNSIEYYKPDIIINAVAYSGISKCEEEPELTFKINALFPRYLAKLSNEYNCLLIHFSSESIFENGGPYTEYDIPKPMNVYANSKNMGDYFVKRICKKYYIFRLPLVFGHSPKHNLLFDKILFSKSQPVKVANDYYTTPTYNKDIAREIKRILGCDYNYGLYNISNVGRASLYDLIKTLRDDVEGVSHNDFPNSEITSNDIGLVTSKLPPMRNWKKAIKEYKERAFIE